MRWTSSEIAILGMATTVVVALLSALTAYLASKRERRRVLYSEAVQAIVSWKEMLYRIRRRGEGQDREIIASFHELQDKLSYYEAWIGSESKYMSRSYTRLVSAVKAATIKLIQVAWAEPLRATPGSAVASDVHPDVQKPVDSFLRDVRGHLSPMPGRKIAVAMRNRRQQIES
jgi:hypothetical protein